jgi:hypothetical protein
LVEDSQKIGPTVATARYASLSESSKGLLFVENVAEQLGIVTTEAGVELRRPPDANTVSAIADLVVNFWPKDFDPLLSVRGDVADGFSVLFWGPITPNSISAGVTRSSLYADRILVRNPFVDLWLFHPKQSPLMRPGAWLSQYCQYAVFIAMLAPWLRSGIVQLVASPLCFSTSLSGPLVSECRASVAVDRVAEEFGSELMIQMAVDCALQVPEANRLDVLRSRTFSGAMFEFAKLQLAATLRTDPVRARIPTPIAYRDGQLTMTGDGLSLPAAKLLAAAAGAEIMTTNSFVAKVIRADADLSSSPGRDALDAFSNLKFGFLNNVPPALSRPFPSSVPVRHCAIDCSSLHPPG